MSFARVYRGFAYRVWVAVQLVIGTLAIAGLVAVAFWLARWAL